MTTYEYLVCPSCGIHYAVDQFVMEHRRRNSKQSWYCPNGHSLVAKEWAADRLQREVNLLKQQQARLEDERREAEKRAAKAEHATHTLKRRIGRGTCPCCKRTFLNVQAHMNRKHPDIAQLPVKAHG